MRISLKVSKVRTEAKQQRDATITCKDMTRQTIHQTNVMFVQVFGTHSGDSEARCFFCDTHHVLQKNQRALGRRTTDSVAGRI